MLGPKRVIEFLCLIDGLSGIRVDTIKRQLRGSTEDQLTWLMAYS